MLINVFNENLLSKYSDISLDDLKVSLEKLFEQDMEVNIVFVKKREIKRLNREYRKTNFVTDVLSFSLDNTGEIYICPSYVKKEYEGTYFNKEIIRLCVHGILHLLGYEHKEPFKKDSKEEMYKVQEEIVSKILKSLEKKMFVVVGLGNLGKEYENTRHNTGYVFVENLGKILKENDFTESDWNTEKIFKADVNVLEKGNVKIVLVKPLTFMNYSGICVKKILKKYTVSDFSKELIVVHDDLDINLGEYKIQLEKSPKGHKGVGSIENHIHTTNFLRVRIGIENRGEKSISGEEYVLRRFSVDEKERINEVIDKAGKELILYLN